MQHNAVDPFIYSYMIAGVVIMFLFMISLWFTYLNRKKH